MLGGFGFFLIAEVSRQIGMAGLAPAWVAVWVPIAVVSLISMTVLLHQEDG
jgi:lipopolysaccharide export system permease protein